MCLEEAEERNLSVHREGVLVRREVKKRTRRERVKTRTSQTVWGGERENRQEERKSGQEGEKEGFVCG